VIQNLAGRRTRSLGGRWRSIVDPYESGYLSPWGDAWPVGWFRNLPVRPGIAEYDFSRADLLDVPGDWNSQDDRLFFYEGSVWYARPFEAQPRAGARTFVHFGAANYLARVWLDGELLGEHEGGFTPFAFEISDRIRAEGNFLVVQVDDTRRPEAVPTTSTDWWNYGGLTRDVCLVEVPGTFVREYELHLADADRIRGWVLLDGPERSGRVRVQLPELGAEASVETDAEGYAAFEIEASPERWSPASPRRYRYEVVIESASDGVSEQVGFRTIETRGSEILLNGEPLFLRGISLHEEAPHRPGRVTTEEDARVLLGWARELGCNFVRLAHYPHSEATVRVAEELGLLVWAEIPVYWSIAWENPDTLACARRQLEELIARDRNRAAVILWSVANEAPATKPRLAFLAELVRHARELDGTRLVTAALMAERREDGTMVLDDPAGEHLDVMGCNEYLGWYYADPDEVPGTRWETPYDKPLIMSEFGAGALQGLHGDPGTPFTEEYQARVYERQIEMLREIPFLAGTSPWILKDFRSPRRVLKDVQDYYNRKGLLSERGVRKQAFEVLRRFYGELSSGQDGVKRGS
jgi:beta-glucuronidase